MGDSTATAAPATRARVRMPKPPHRIVAQLDVRTRQLKMRRLVVAAAIGVHPSAMGEWVCGVKGPMFAHALAWAHHVQLRMVVLGPDRELLAEGADIPKILGPLRRQAGKTQQEVADLRHVSHQTI